MARWRVLLVVILGLGPVVAAGALAAGSSGQATTSSARAAKGAVTLVTPHGRALKGPWQRWADRAVTLGPGEVSERAARLRDALREELSA